MRASAPLDSSSGLANCANNLTPGADRRAGSPIISRDISRTGVLGAGGQQRGTPVS